MKYIRLNAKVSNFCYSIHFTKLDVTIKEDWVRAWDEAEDVLGGKIEILCNNAGVPPRVCSFNSMLEEIICLLIDICRLEWT